MVNNTDQREPLSAPQLLNKEVAGLQRDVARNDR